jgi:hypothetical protein
MLVASVERSRACCVQERDRVGEKRGGVRRVRHPAHIYRQVHAVMFHTVASTACRRTA